MFRNNILLPSSWRYNSEDSTLHSHHHENPIYNIKLFIHRARETLSKFLHMLPYYVVIFKSHMFRQRKFWAVKTPGIRGQKCLIYSFFSYFCVSVKDEPRSKRQTQSSGKQSWSESGELLDFFLPMLEIQPLSSITKSGHYIQKILTWRRASLWSFNWYKLMNWIGYCSAACLYAFTVFLFRWIEWLLTEVQISTQENWEKEALVYCALLWTIL
jgi:hypothetical protein